MSIAVGRHPVCPRDGASLRGDGLLWLEGADLAPEVRSWWHGAIAHPIAGRRKRPPAGLVQNHLSEARAAIDIGAAERHKNRRRSAKWSRVIHLCQANGIEGGATRPYFGTKASCHASCLRWHCVEKPLIEFSGSNGGKSIRFLVRAIDGKVRIPDGQVW